MRRQRNRVTVRLAVGVAVGQLEQQQRERALLAGH
jgi:hypothetical protein